MYFRKSSILLKKKMDNQLLTRLKLLDVKEFCNLYGSKPFFFFFLEAICMYKY